MLSIKYYKDRYSVPEIPANGNEKGYIIMEDMRPYQLALIDSLQGRPGGPHGEKQDDALRILRRHYGVDYGMNPQAWLNYVLENDQRFIEQLNSLYHQVHTIETYKNTLIDIDNRDDILFP